MIFYKKFFNVKIKIGKKKKRFSYRKISSLFFLFRISVQQSVIRLLTMDLTNEIKYLHLLFPTTLSELNLLNSLLENYKQQKNISSSLLKLTKKVFKSATIENLSTTIERFLQGLVEHDDRENILLPLLQQHDEILRLVEHHRPNWIKFAIIYILLGIQTIKQQNNNEYIQLSTLMIFKLLKKLSKEVGLTDIFLDLYRLCVY